jgi:hypothetical protein
MSLWEKRARFTDDHIALPAKTEKENGKGDIHLFAPTMRRHP